MGPPVWTDEGGRCSRSKNELPPSRGAAVCRRTMAPDQPIAHPPPARSAHHALLFGIARNKRAVGYFFAGMICAVVAVGALFLYTDLSWSGLIEWIEQLN